MDFNFVMRLLFSSTLAFLLTFYLVPLCIAMAHRLRILDVPDGKIKKHLKTTPYLGGVAVYLGFIISLAVTLPFNNSLLHFILGATLLLFVGLIDDLIALKYYQKLFGQALAAFSFLKGGLHLKETFFLASSWTLPISFVWMLLISNAFNLVDVMDGLATTLALWSTASFILLALVLQQSTIAIVLSSLGGALLAFLWYNKPPASIYLGDAGSLFIGGLLAVTPFFFEWRVHNKYGLAVPLIILSIPLLEVAGLIIIRSYKRIPFYYASPHHFCFYLIHQGWTKDGILVYMSIASLYTLLISILFILDKIGVGMLAINALIFLVIWLSFLRFSLRKLHNFIKSLSLDAMSFILVKK